jgi:tripartite-type tricarboxylate transporter receptor subunit TctC
VVAPAGTPKEIVQQLNKAFTQALSQPDVKNRFASLMADPVPTSPEQFGELMTRERAKYETVVRRSGAKLG